MSRYRIFYRTAPSNAETVQPYRAALTIGSYKPSASTAGILGDSVRPLSVYNGNYTAAPNEIIKDKVINGKVIVNVTGVVIENCHIRGTATAPTTNAGLVEVGTNGFATIQDCLLEPQVPHEFWDGIRTKNYIAKRNIIRNVTDAFGAFNSGAVNVQILGNWVQNLTRWNPDSVHTDGTHNDCIQLQGGSGAVIRGNWLQCVLDTQTGNTSGVNRQSGGPYYTGTAAIMLNQNVGSLTDVLIEDNWLDGGEIGINGGGITNAGNLGIIRRNRFDHSQTLNTPGTSNTWTCNVNPNSTVTIGTGADANVYDDTGAAINFRRSA